MKNLLPFVLLPVLLFSNSLPGQQWACYDTLKNEYVSRQSYDTALIYAEKAAEEYYNTVGENDTTYAILLNSVMEVEYYNGDYESAISYGEKALAIRLNTLGERHLEYANTCAWLGYLYFTTGKYPAAEEMYKKTIEARRALFGEKDDSFARAVNNLALLYVEMGNYKAAKPLYLKARDIYKELYGEKHEAYARALSNIAALYDDLGDYAAAEPLYIEAKNIRKEVLGEKHPEYATSLNTLAYLYDVTGNFSAAEQLYTEALNIRKEVLGVKHKSYAVSLNNLAFLYKEMGNYEAAEPLYETARNIWKEVLGERHPTYATALDNLALLYRAMGRYEEAGPLYREALEIRRESLGEKHPRYALSLNNLAYYYWLTDNYAASESLFVESASIMKEVLGEKHPSYALALENQAKLYVSVERYPEAEKLNINALTIRKEVLGENHPDYGTSLINLAGFYYKTGRLEEAGPLFTDALRVINNAIMQNFAFLSEREKELYFKIHTGSIDEFYSYAMKYYGKNPAISKEVYDNILKTKGLLLKSSTAMRTAILNSNDTALFSKYEEWIELKRNISRLNSTEISSRKEDPEILARQANELEKELVRASGLFDEIGKLQQLRWESVMNKLKPGEAAVEYLHFTDAYDGNKIKYYALLISPASDQPEMISLFEEGEMQSLLDKYRGSSFKSVSGVYGTNADTNEELYRLIWEPLEPFLKDIKTIYYSPDGILHKISFPAIGKGKNIFLCDEYNLLHVISTGKIVNAGQDKNEKIQSACVFGGIDYDTDSEGKAMWPYLPGSLTESEIIQEKFVRKNIIFTGNTAKEASEEKFKDIYSKNGIRPEILHIATHGFFYPDPDIQLKSLENESQKKHEVIEFRGSSGTGLWQFVQNKNPLMRSGLLFAGANRAWSEPYSGTDNEGVLTAQEVTQLDMGKTRLVVLSACETGLGDIRGSEGVYGLQRAFKMAGVKYIIMSLWQVPDKETVEFMELFYKKLLKFKDVRRSFNETQ
ncbi:MAG: CHAT domain-containing tetratricopeptide repeat protein, partial [Bacteroidota bacterium]